MANYAIRDISIVREIDRARKDLNSLKSSQYISRKGLATKKTESTPILSKTIAAPSGTATMEVLYLSIQFVADNQVSPYGRLALELYDQYNNLLDSNSGVAVLYLNEVVTQIDDGLLEWNIHVRSRGEGSIDDQKYYIKLIVYATDTGRIKWIND